MSDYSKLKILLIEDNAYMRAILITILKGIGISDIREARDGTEALELLQDFYADIAMADYNMGPINGVEFTRMLRMAPDSINPYLPVIMISGHAARHRVIEARDAGVTEFIVKPLTARALISRLEALVMRPRPFIRCATYFGPDRRRSNDPHFSGPYRRSIDNHQTQPSHIL